MWWVAIRSPSVSTRPPAIEITITDSTVSGDVVAGDKIVNVVLHEDQLVSKEAVANALGAQGIAAGAADDLIQDILNNPDFLARFDAKRQEYERTRVEQQLQQMVRDYERSGASSTMLDDLLASIDKARRMEDWVTFSTAGVAYLSLTFSDLSRQANAQKLATELVAVGQRDTAFRRNIPVARICLSRHVFFQYTQAALELSTLLKLYQQRSIQLPLVNLLAERKNVLGLLALSDAYAMEAINVALELGQADVLIYVLFGVASIQEHVHFHFRYSMQRDAAELADRVRRTYQLLENLISQYGTPSDAATMQSDVANFCLQTTEFELAEMLALRAAQELAKLGDANGATRAFKIVDQAKSRKPVFIPPRDEDVQALPLEQIVAAMKEFSDRLMQMSGIDPTQSPLREEIEAAWLDFNPNTVLRHCEHVKLGCVTSALGEAVGIPTMGEKLLTCHKVNRTMKGPRLPRLFELFQEGLQCSSCSHRAPRPAEWNWSPFRKD